MSELVLVIEDEKEIQDLIRYNLEKAGYRVAAAKDGDTGLERLFASRPDAVILDLMLPGATGLDILKEVRAEPTTLDLPVLVLTARSTEMDKLIGFEHGADDYLTKPFSPRELVARVKALLRRARPGPSGGKLAAGTLEMDTLAREAALAGKTLTLTRREFDLLAFFLQHPGHVHSREELLRKVWGYDYMGETRTVDVHVRRLRLKLGEASKLIETVTGSGYKLVTESRPDAGVATRPGKR
jgi:DNA-binding response OmpR family regulator